jgi:hypothetical protein
MPQACPQAPTVAQILAGIPQLLIDSGYTHQPQTNISQANPVSDTIYNVLPNTANVRLIGLSAKITWGVTQPTNLRIIVTADGEVITFTLAAPVTATNYIAALSSQLTHPNQLLFVTTSLDEQHRAFMLESKNVQVDVAVTWGVTQPTPLECNVEYAIKT